MFYIIYNMIILNLICPGIRVSVPLLNHQFMIQIILIYLKHLYLKSNLFII